MRPLLWSAVRNLAQPPDVQATICDGASIDELALDFDAQPWHDEPHPIQHALAELDRLLELMSGTNNAELWTPEALHGPEWQRVREAARRVMTSHQA
jgi:hypothetical protein